MNKQNTSVLPDENKIEEMLGKIQPVPSEGFHQRMRQALWLRKQNRPSLIPLRMRVAIAMTVVIVLVVLAATPQGRAWAQEAVQFFKQINVTTIPLSEKQAEQWNAPTEPYDLPLIPVIISAPPAEMLSIPGCETAAKAQSYSCQVAYAESQLKFDLLELSEKPQNLEFNSVEFNTTTKSSAITYGQFGLDLRITQGLGKTPGQYGAWDWAPVGKVEKVKIGNFDGEYVSGSFTLLEGGTEWVWSDHEDKQRLAWSDGTYWYLFESEMFSGQANYLSRDQLIQLAGSMIRVPQIQEEQLDPNAPSSTVYSISDAEKISGLDLKAPTILPMDVDFSDARYTAFNQQVELEYGVNNELVIREWAGEPIDFHQSSDMDGIRPLDKHEIVHVNGKEAYFGSDEGGDPFLFLWWYQDGLNYQLYYHQYFGVIDKDKLITIADSMQDIDDFRAKGKKNYTQIILYEQALGIDAKKFSQTPEGWSFYNFWGNPSSKCIDLMYTSTRDQSTMQINQCKTDILQYLSDAPRKYTDRVKVRNTKGTYIAGGYITTEDGKQVWDATSPKKTLLWQEDGLWMHIIVTGDAALGTNKEDLISYAESLQ